MIVYPNAKINLGLNILKKREDGYHDISSIFYPVKECVDILEIIQSEQFEFTNSGIEIPEGESPESMHEIADKAETLLSNRMEANVVSHVDPVTVDDEALDKIKSLILENLRLMEINASIQDLRIMNDQGVKSIHFQIPVSVEFQQKEQFQRQCMQDLEKNYPNCQVFIEFKSQMTMEN